MEKLPRYGLFVLIALLCVAGALFARKPLAGWALARGDFYFNGGAYDAQKAALFYRGATVADGSNAGAHYQLGRVYFVLGKHAEALSEMNTALALRPDFAKAYYMRGLIYGTMGNQDAAESDFKKILELEADNPAIISDDPGGWAVFNDLAWAQFKKGNYSDMQKTAEAGIKRYPNNPWLLNSLGLALFNLDERDRAKDIFDHALAEAEKLTPEDVGRAYPGNDPSNYEKQRNGIIMIIRLNRGLK